MGGNKTERRPLARSRIVKRRLGQKPTPGLFLLPTQKKDRPELPTYQNRQNQRPDCRLYDLPPRPKSQHSLSEIQIHQIP